MMPVEIEVVCVRVRPEDEHAARRARVTAEHRTDLRSRHARVVRVRAHTLDYPLDNGGAHAALDFWRAASTSALTSRRNPLGSRREGIRPRCIQRLTVD